MPATITADQWATCKDPQAMVAFLAGKVPDRKLLLFACACSRLHWSLLRDIRSQKAIETLEHYADGLVDRQALEVARIAAEAAVPPDPAGCFDTDVNDFEAHAAHSASLLVDLSPRNLELAQDAIVGTVLIGAMLDPRANRPGESVFPDPTKPLSFAETARHMQRLALADLLRHLIGDTFPPRQWDFRPEKELVRMAATVYEGTQPAAALRRLLDNQRHGPIIAHLRKTTDHPKGCWALDALLGK